ncbi:ubiquitin domain-containing protein UBFD1-like isoform X2 [Patiria miniata]|uniref:Ubiquitin-like domain-containing protein n=1 Tax=Patiria miniata TaxID=46514 RepID=A0A914AK89_PATMI|nr:ubiquitin domain-containing protein UBFD1-like isoform X2 [Patiria miniata]
MATNSGDTDSDADMRDNNAKKPKCSPPESTMDTPDQDKDVKNNSNDVNMESASQQSQTSNSQSQTNSACEPTDSSVCMATEHSPKDSGNSEETAMDVSGEAEMTTASGETAEETAKPKELVDFKVMYNKQKYDVSFDLDGTVATLKTHVQTLTGVPSEMQKLMYRGLMKDDKTLRELNVTKGVKLMLIGSTRNDILEVNKPVPKGAAKVKEEAAPAKEPLCKQKMHKKILDKGIPDDAMPGIKGRQEALPSVPISGMYNKAGGKVRLTFKLEIDQLWIGTKERTEKLPMSSIKNVISEPIEGHEEYHIMAIQLGPTEQSRYWLYWVPTQYTSAIKDAILFKWQYF